MMKHKNSKPGSVRTPPSFAACQAQIPKPGIYGIAKSPGAAIKSWRINLQQRFDRINGQEIQLNSWRSAAFRMVSS